MGSKTVTEIDRKPETTSGIYYRPLESVQKYKLCGQTGRQTTDGHNGIYQNRDSILQRENSSDDVDMKVQVHGH